MKRELSQKEREETVNKGYFYDTFEEVLENKNYVTKDYFHITLEEILESKNYVTKDWALDMFETFQKSIENNLREDFQRHTNSLVEMIRHENKIISEAIMSRVERIERHVSLDPL